MDVGDVTLLYETSLCRTKKNVLVESTPQSMLYSNIYNIQTKQSNKLIC